MPARVSSTGSRLGRVLLLTTAYSLDAPILLFSADPVAHSLSPRLHTAALKAAGIEGTYEARRVDADGMVAAVEEIRTGELNGANVTMPHKRLAAASGRSSSVAEAARAGSVNTLSSCKGRRWWGRARISTVSASPGVASRKDRP